MLARQIPLEDGDASGLVWLDLHLSKLNVVLKVFQQCKPWLW